MSDPSTTPTAIRAPHGSPWFEVTWGDGKTLRLPNALLRAYCPCAGCQGHSGRIVYTPGHDSEMRDIETVGNYALRFVWGDAHGSGLYSFAYLRKLAELYATHGETLPEVHPEFPRR